MAPAEISHAVDSANIVPPVTSSWSGTAWWATGWLRRFVPVTTEGAWRVTVFAEEADAAYDRVGLTSYTEKWDRALLALPGNDYAGDERVRVCC